MKILLSYNMNIITKYLEKNSLIGFVPTASDVESDKSYMLKNIEVLKQMGYDIIIVDISHMSKEKIISTLNKIDALFVSGGNCYYLLEKIKEKNILQDIIEFASKKIYIGVSAGSCIASPSIGYVHNLDDMKCAPNLTDSTSLNFINAYILPHYNNSSEYDVLIDKTIDEYSELNFITLTDKKAIVVNSNSDYEIVATD